MKINRMGITRIVLVFRNVVIKIPNFKYQWNHFLRGLLANINEHTTYKVQQKYHPENLHLLCPIVWCSWGGWVLIMKRAEVTNEFEDYTEHMKLFPGDDKPCNYGIYQGRLVKIDYGS